MEELTLDGEVWYINFSYEDGSIKKYGSLTLIKNNGIPNIVAVLNLLEELGLNRDTIHFLQFPQKISIHDYIEWSGRDLQNEILPRWDELRKKFIA